MLQMIKLFHSKFSNFVAEYINIVDLIKNYDYLT